MSVTITLRGRHYTVRSDEPEEDVLAVAQWVDQKVGEIASRSRGVPEETLALLACLNIANEYHRFRKKVLAEVADVDRELQAVGEILDILVPGSSLHEEIDDDTEGGLDPFAGPEDLPNLPDEDWADEGASAVGPRSGK
jgi:cell division protein ZapA (FtsZ GTPase activity inhibitor)